MKNLIIVDDPIDLPLRFEGVELVGARSYLAEPAYAGMRGAKIFNLCRSYRYQSTGYYVSLLAAARGHKPIPSITTIQDMKSVTLVRAASEELRDIIQKSLAPIQSKAFILSIYFGRNLAKRHDYLSLHLFKIFQTPFLRAVFSYQEKNGSWNLQNINPIAASDIPEEHRDFAVQSAQEFFGRRRMSARRRSRFRYDLAILHNPTEKEPPSNQRALQHFIRSAESMGMAAELIQKEDYSRLAEFDALFIRETTAVTHHTYRFARKALAEGLVIVDDPESILKCTNKVFLAELFERHKILTPRTVIVHRGNAGFVSRMLGLPCILKRPDGSYSLGVMKVENEEEFAANVEEMLDRSDLVIAQEFLATDYDWRIGIFDHQPLFACKYYMARRHWQIIKWDNNGMKKEEGRAETLALDQVPAGAVRAALRAANLIGSGLYGVDIKQRGNRFYIMEVNDNPSINAGDEDRVLKEELYRRIMRVFLSRIEQRKGGK